MELYYEIHNVKINPCMTLIEPGSLVLYLPVKLTIVESLGLPMRDVPLLLHMTLCTVKVHKVMEFDIVKSEQDTYTVVSLVALRQFPQLVDTMW